MKKIIVSILLSSFIVLAFSQNHKILNLSGGGVCIAGIAVEKNKTNQFVIVCDSSVAISQVILNAGKTGTLRVKDADGENLYKESITNFTNWKIGGSPKDTLQLFVFENSHNYQIEHDNKTWNIIVRKRKSLQTGLYLEDENLHIGDSCIAIRDTMHIALTDSLILSKWDRQLSLFKNGVQLKDSLYLTVDDSCCYYVKTILSKDSIIHANDTLSIKLSNNRLCVVVFEKSNDTQSNYLWLLLLLPIILLLYYAFKKQQQRKKNQNPNQVLNNDFSDVPDSDVSKVDDNKQECWSQLNKLLDELLEVQRKCEEICQSIKKNQTILTENSSPMQDSVSNQPDTLIKRDTPNAKSESNRFVDILSILSVSYNELKDSYNKDVMAAADEARRNAEDALNATLKELEKRANDAEEKALKAENSKEEAIADAVKKEQESHEKEVKRLKDDKQKAEERAQLAEQSKKEAVDDAVQREKESHVKEEKRLRESKEKAEAELSRTTRSLETTQKELRDTRTDRDKKNIEIQQLKKAQEQFTRSLSSVPFAETYSKQIHELLKLGSQIQTAAYSILDSNVEDPYFIMKAIFKYGKMIDEIDMENFLTDINMASKANFVFKDSSLTTFKEDNKDIDGIVRSYFFNQYLEKYINAIMVLNESMSGLKLLLPEVQSKVTTFDKYRDEILLLAKKLKVSVLFVRVGDMAGENIDLKAKTVDVEIGKPGQILEIENCIVYPIDNRKPQTKIKVTIKK